MDHAFIAVHYFGIIWMVNFQVIFFFSLFSLAPRVSCNFAFSPVMCSGGSERLQTEGPGRSSWMLGAGQEEPQDPPEDFDKPRPLAGSGGLLGSVSLCP